MALTRQVNGITKELTEDEEKAIRAEWKANEEARRVEEEKLAEDARRRKQALAKLESLGLTGEELKTLRL